MDQLGRLGRGPRGEVVLLHQGGLEPPAGGVEGHPGTGDAPADDQHVEVLARPAGPGRRPVGTGRRGGSAAPARSGMAKACHTRAMPAAVRTGPDGRQAGVAAALSTTIVEEQSLVISCRPMRTPEELTELFRSTGRKVTAQRQCIFRVLQGDETHPSAEAVHALASREMETISLKTVYQTLHDLAELGEIATLDVGHRDDPVRSQRGRSPPPSGVPAVRQRARPGGRLPRPADPRGCRPGVRGGLGRDRLPRPVPRLPGADPDRRRRPGAGCSHDCRSADRTCQTPIRTATTVVEVTTTDHSNERNTVPALKDSKTEANLKEAFAGESQANRRYLYFAQKADVEGYPDVAALFRSVAEGETGHAFGHFDFLREVGDPVTGVPVGPTEDNLKSAIEGETYEYSEMYPGLRPDRPRRGVRRDRRVARDAGPRREEPCRPVHRGTGLRRLSPTRARWRRPVPATTGPGPRRPRAW